MIYNAIMYVCSLEWGGKFLYPWCYLLICCTAVNPLGPTEIDCVIYLYGAVSQMTWQMLVLGTGEEQPKTKKNRGKPLKKPRPTWGS